MLYHLWPSARKEKKRIKRFIPIFESIGYNNFWSIGRLVKHLAKDRIALAKLMKGAEGAAAEEVESLTAKAMQDVKLATLCLKYAAL